LVFPDVQRRSNDKDMVTVVIARRVDKKSVEVF